MKHCSVLTSMGSNTNSWSLYLKTKGQIEESSKEEAFEYTSIFRPGLLDRGGDKRTVEKIAGEGSVAVTWITEIADNVWVVELVMSEWR